MLQDQDLLSIQEVRTKVEAAWQAAQRMRQLSQDQVDAIVEAMAAAARDQSAALAEMAVAETSYGNARDKTAKNLLAADLLPKTIRGLKTVGVIREIPEEKRYEIGVPVGVVAAILPTTNPTSTAIYKSIIAVKGGNAIVISPHPRAKNCTCATAQVLADAAVRAGAPEGLIQCLKLATIEATNALMRHEKTAVILATGGSAMVKAAYSSGKPAFGVGPGNVPVLVDPSADVAEAVRRVVQGKSFDYGTLCSSEQTLVAERSLREGILAELRKQKAFLRCRAGRASGADGADAEVGRESRVRGPSGAQDRADGRLRSAGGYDDSGGGDSRHWQAASAFGGKAFAGAGASLCGELPGGARCLRGYFAARRTGPYVRDSCAR